MRKKLIVSAIAVILIAGASAQTDTGQESLEEIGIDKIKEEVNSNQEEIPGFIGTIVGNQRINVEFTSTGMNFSAVMDGTRIESIDNSTLEDPTLKAEVEDDALQAVIESNSSIDELKRQLEEGDIAYEALTAGNKVKIFIGDKLLGIGSRLGLL